MPASFGDFAPCDFDEALPLKCPLRTTLVCPDPDCKCELTTQYTSTPLHYKVIYGDDHPDGDYLTAGEMMGCLKCRLQWYNLSMPSHDSKLETPDEGATYIVKAIGLPRCKWVKAWSRVDNPTAITFRDPPPPADDDRNTETTIVAYDAPKPWWKRFLGFLGRIVTCGFFFRSSNGKSWWKW